MDLLLLLAEDEVHLVVGLMDKVDLVLVVADEVNLVVRSVDEVEPPPGSVDKLDLVVRSVGTRSTSCTATRRRSNSSSWW